MALRMYLHVRGDFHGKFIRDLADASNDLFKHPQLGVLESKQSS